MTKFRHTGELEVFHSSSIGLVNARSVRNKADFIKEYFVEHNYAIVALSETWLTRDDQAEINVLTHVC